MTMIDYKYGQCSDAQLAEYKRSLHSLIHWILRYKDAHKYDILSHYFDTVQYKLNGASSLFKNDPNILKAMGLIESARVEFDKGENCNQKLFRSAILDAHTLIDRVGEPIGV